MSSLREVLTSANVDLADERVDDALSHLSTPSPWFVRVAVGAGTWVGSFLLGLALVLSGAWDNTGAALLFGFMLMAASTATSRLATGTAAGQFVLASSLGGQALVLIALGKDLHSTQIALLFAALQLLMIFGARDATHRFLSAASGLGALAIALGTAGIPTTPLVLAALVAVCFLFLDEARLLGGAAASLVRPVAYGLASGVLALSLAPALPRDLANDLPIGRDGGMWNAIWSVSVAGVGLWVGARAFREAGVAFGGRGFLVAVAGGVATLGFAFQVPGLLVAFVLLVVAHSRREFILGGLACTFLAAFYGVFCFDLALPLLTKSFAIAGSGLVFFVMFAALHRREVPETAPTGAAPKAQGLSRDRLVLAVTALATLALVVGLAVTREAQRTRGRIVLLRLAPVDPRSLIEGDFMTLRYAIEDELRERMDTDRVAVLRLDAQGVGTFERFDDGSPIGAEEQRILVRKRGWNVTIGAPTYFIEEGTADRYNDARYGELRVSEAGTPMISGLRGESLEVLGKGP